MGVVCILLGIIAFLTFTTAGAVIAVQLVNYKASMSLMLTSLSSISDANLYIIIIGLFTFIGLLVCVSMVVQGLTYNKIAKMQTMLRRRG